MKAPSISHLFLGLFTSSSPRPSGKLTITQSQFELSSEPYFNILWGSTNIGIGE